MQRALGKGTFASVNGKQVDAAALACSIWDVTFQRGDGVFEAVRVVPSGGSSSSPPKPRALPLHLDRLERSAKSLRLALPPREEIASWLRAAAAAGGTEGYVRLIVTRGGGSPGYGDHLGDLLEAPPKTIAIWQPLSRAAVGSKPLSKRLCPLAAPWHPAGFDSKNWATTKWLAYGANVHSTRLATEAGYDDALLLARGWGVSDDAPTDNEQRVVLDGPNFAVAWAREDGVFCTPSWKKLGMLQSVTCTLALRAAERAGLRVDEGVHTLADISKAHEAWVLSTGNDLTPISALGETALPDAPNDSMRDLLLEHMQAIVDEYD